MHIAKYPMYIHPYAPLYSMKAKRNTALQMTEITFIMTAQTTLQGEKDTYMNYEACFLLIKKACLKPMSTFNNTYTVKYSYTSYK